MIDSFTIKLACDPTWRSITFMTSTKSTALCRVPTETSITQQVYYASTVIPIFKKKNALVAFSSQWLLLWQISRTREREFPTRQLVSLFNSWGHVKGSSRPVFLRRCILVVPFDARRLQADLLKKFRALGYEPSGPWLLPELIPVSIALFRHSKEHSLGDENFNEAKMGDVNFRKGFLTKFA